MQLAFHWHFGSWEIDTKGITTYASSLWFKQFQPGLSTYHVFKQIFLQTVIYIFLRNH